MKPLILLLLTFYVLCFSSTPFTWRLEFVIISTTRHQVLSSLSLSLHLFQLYGWFFYSIFYSKKKRKRGLNQRELPFLLVKWDLSVDRWSPALILLNSEEKAEPAVFSVPMKHWSSCSKILEVNPKTIFFFCFFCKFSKSDHKSKCVIHFYPVFNYKKVRL